MIDSKHIYCRFLSVLASLFNILCTFVVKN
nr:MAG TPA: hypothetical protein [Caudoviricetes sp.]